MYENMSGFLVTMKKKGLWTTMVIALDKPPKTFQKR